MSKVNKLYSDSKNVNFTVFVEVILQQKNFFLYEKTPARAPEKLIGK